MTMSISNSGVSISSATYYVYNCNNQEGSKSLSNGVDYKYASSSGGQGSTQYKIVEIYRQE